MEGRPGGREGKRELANSQRELTNTDPSTPISFTMNSVIESSRQTHEEIDLYEQALAAIFLQTDDSVSPSGPAHQPCPR